MVPDAVLMDTQEELTDLLDRKAFVARLIDVVEILSENRKNASFAVNGAWGVGKTFVLNRFEEEIAKYPLEKDGPRKYLVFHYDCWKYDYYEEPLIALVAALTDSIDKQTNFISADKRTTFKVVLKEIIAGLVEVGSVKTGFDIKKIFETIKSARNKATQEIADSHDFDVYFSFNCILEKLRAAIKDLAEEQTILLVVDELDRCLPEYTITVLERLHHVLEGIPNVQTIISIDKEQLECTVRQIYQYGSAPSDTLQPDILPFPGSYPGNCRSLLEMRLVLPLQSHGQIHTFLLLMAECLLTHNHLLKADKNRFCSPSVQSIRSCLQNPCGFLKR